MRVEIFVAARLAVGTTVQGVGYLSVLIMIGGNTVVIATMKNYCDNVIKIHCVNAACTKPREILFTENNSIKFTALKSTEMFTVKDIQLINKFFQTNALPGAEILFKN
jgi:acylphosphatase